MAESWAAVALPVYKGDEVAAITLVDPADRDLERWTWRWLNGYAVRYPSRALTNGVQTSVRMAREVLGLRKGDRLQADHINRNRLDNRRANLRAVTRAGNIQNCAAQRGSSSPFRGVFREQGKWRAGCSVNDRMHFIGYFDDEVEAALAAEQFRQEHLPYAEPDPALRDRLREISPDA